jgi:4-amino-4-deoxy-L-arabinose transferase-like glycosyltransferase
MSDTAEAVLEVDRTAVVPKHAWVRHLFPAMLVALAIRMVVVYFYFRDLPDANLHYEQFGWEMGWIARALASGHGFSSPYWPWSGPTAMQPPLYPTLLSLDFRLFGIYSLTAGFVILSMNSLFSALTCIPVYFSAKYSMGTRAAKIAAWVWAFYPFAIYFSAGRVWEYSLTCLLFTTCFCIAQRIHRADRPWSWLGWGALFGVTALSNPAVLSTLPFLLAAAIYQVRSSGRRWLFKGVLTIVAAVAVLTPWTIRNLRALGILCPVRDNFWLELYDDNYGTWLLDPSFAHPSSNPVEMKKFLAMGEPAFLAEKKSLILNYLRQHPEFIVEKTLRRILYYWTGYWSFSAEELREQPYEPWNVFYVSSITFLMLLGVRRLWHANRTACMPYLALICIFPVTYYITHPLMDYREPIGPAVVVLAVSGFLSLRREKVVKLPGAEDDLVAEAE